MRTTLTLDDDVAAALQRLGKARGIRFKSLVNETLREGLRHMTARSKKGQPFQTRSVDLGRCFLPNVDNVAEVLAVVEGDAHK